MSSTHYESDLVIECAECIKFWMSFNATMHKNINKLICTYGLYYYVKSIECFGLYEVLECNNNRSEIYTTQQTYNAYNQMYDDK